MACLTVFLIYMKSKINHLIPLLSITSEIEVPRETESPLTLLYYEIIARQILKLSERNLIYTNNIEENEMIGRIG